jgi:hypothetical protein
LEHEENRQKCHEVKQDLQRFQNPIWEVPNSNHSHRHHKEQHSDATALDKPVTRVTLDHAPGGDAVCQNKACAAYDSANDVCVNGNHFRRIVAQFTVTA